MEFNKCTFFAIAAVLLFIYFVVTLSWYLATNHCDDTSTTTSKELEQQICRSYDGTGNNFKYPNWGDAHSMLAVDSDAKASRTLSTESKINPDISPRTISNEVCSGVSVDSVNNLSNLFWLWGQFIDHTLDLTPTQVGDDAETMNMETIVEPGELFPGRTIPFTRSQFQVVDGIRRFPSVISSYLDGTSIYGDVLDRASGLRTMDGTGMLKTSTSDNGEVLLPKNDADFPNANAGPTPSDELFLAGDIRANENAHLTAMHTIFVREHNRRCLEIVAEKPELQGEDELIYQRARRLTIGVLQAVTFYEFLPLLLGSSVLTQYEGYKDDINATLSVEFTTAAYRFGHTMVSETQPLGASGNTGEVELVNIFFNPSYVQQNGVNDLLIGGGRSKMQEIDGILVNDLRNSLFGPPTAQILHDLAAINIQRGRDHGIPCYTEALVKHGLPEPTQFSELNMSLENKGKLAAVYNDVSEIDMWIGGILERHDDEAEVGPLFKTILTKEFLRIRDGDRFWFENDAALSKQDVEALKATKLSDVLSRNVPFEFPSEAFVVK
jgi:hypothetical protein